MTREEIIEKVCLSSEIQNDECIDCSYCMEVLNDYFDKYDKQIRAEVIEKTLKEVDFEEKWLNDAIREDKGNYTYNIDMAFSGIKHSLNKLKEQK